MSYASPESLILLTWFFSFGLQYNLLVLENDQRKQVIKKITFDSGNYLNM